MKKTKKKVIIETTPKDLVNIIKMAKIEVFDDIGKIPLYVISKKKGNLKTIYAKDCDWFKELMKRHLSPSKEGTSNSAHTLYNINLNYKKGVSALWRKEDGR